MIPGLLPCHVSMFIMSKIITVTKPNTVTDIQQPQTPTDILKACIGYPLHALVSNMSSITLNSGVLHTFGVVPVVLTQSPHHSLDLMAPPVPVPRRVNMIPKLEVAKITKASDLWRIVQQ